ncbi:UDP-2-acetamido-2,6-beta-L-arabino-hexul-4-ose reductase [Jeongeupia naejangsanensis]|uniref:NAD-dependent epimerase/dehydratase family protein n=1 Tax=Jeongeupia naejangsanensis TaxID=613195 RepID=A0ABS2BP24_9NEIS|nr:NAD-dependent epimerase/dehydratase family protein [Jeongeupia naejangsanensis]MBM3117384.1 NAD-dependent epimerase/dehydratase family protein [Jeongeupia naejangsanensis]
MRVLVTGSRGFVGKNLVLRLQEHSDIEVLEFARGDSDEQLLEVVRAADAVIHLAGENRPPSPEAFEEVNVALTQRLCEALRGSGNRAPLILASSAQAELDNPYGRSKLAAERVVAELAEANGNSVMIYRLPGVFGKWCKPNYNSVVATFCHNIANDLPIQINDPDRAIRLVYVDDVLYSFLCALESPQPGVRHDEVAPEYGVTLGELAGQIAAFKNCRSTLISERVGAGLTRALYATYVSYLPKEKFAYDVPAYGDARGVFVEMLKTPDAGQFSFFTAHPGVTRGGHYHHSKTEKFLVIKGRARFGFRHMLTDEVYYLETSGSKPQIVETVPGWTHDITNIGDDEMVVMLWANEIFDREHPDTIASKV